MGTGWARLARPGEEVRTSVIGAGRSSAEEIGEARKNSSTNRDARGGSHE